MQEVIGSNPIFSTNRAQQIENQSIGRDFAEEGGQMMATTENGNVAQVADIESVKPCGGRAESGQFFEHHDTGQDGERDARRKKMISISHELRAYKVPRLVCNQAGDCYVVFYAYDPASGKLKRKRIHINSVKPRAARRKFGADLCRRLSERLADGWNPWLDPDPDGDCPVLSDMFDKYRRFCDKMLHDGVYRETTHKAYVSHLRLLMEYIDSQKVPIRYVYQLDKGFIVKYLDHIYLERECATSTRNNYLLLLKQLCHWAVGRDIMTRDPTEGISLINRRSNKKNRDVIPFHTMDRIYDWCSRHNRHYLLVCYLLYYCFIRPKELLLLKIEYFSIKRQTVFIPGDVSKNRKDGTVTVPKKVLLLMIELGVFNSPGSYYLFGNDFAPSETRASVNVLSNYWAYHVRKALGLPDSYKLYSLKDTGITNMLRKCDTLSVRDQARHSSVLMTDIYTPHDIEQANDLLKEFDGDF